MSIDCGYNLYWNGSRCIECLIGFYGKNCAVKCENGTYGRNCGKRCSCSSDICNHRSGCSQENNSNPTSNSENLEYTSTVSFPPGSTNDVISSTSDNFEMPSDTSNTPFSQNIQISLIGGLIALFLLILIVKSFIKLHLKRKERAHKIFIKTDSEQQEDLYQAIADGAIENNENQENSKYYRLRSSNVASNVPNEQRGNYMHYQEIYDNCDSSNSSNSSNNIVESSSNDRQNYLDVLGSNVSKDMIVKEGNELDLTSQNNIDPSAQYIEPVQNASLLAQGNTSSKTDYGDNGAYLDVTNESIL